MQEKNIDNWIQKLQYFLCEYVSFDDFCYEKSGKIKTNYLKNAIKVLLEDNIFSNRQDIRQQAMKDFHITIPEEFFI